VPIDGVAAIDSEPGDKKHRRPKPPFPLKNDAETPRGGEISENGHDEADWNIPVWRAVVERTEDQQCDTNRKRSKFPGAEIFSHMCHKPGHELGSPIRSPRYYFSASSSLMAINCRSFGDPLYAASNCAFSGYPI